VCNVLNFLDPHPTHPLRFLNAPLGTEETGTASPPIVFQDATFAPGPAR
jgi:hypothetical protein